jgi:hypothetical protein
LIESTEIRGWSSFKTKSLVFQQNEGFSFLVSHIPYFAQKFTLPVGATESDVEELQNEMMPRHPVCPAMSVT